MIGAIYIGAFGFILFIAMDYIDRIQGWEHPATKKTAASLPGLDCGACGFPSCLSYAKAVDKGLEDEYCRPKTLLVSSPKQRNAR